MSYTEIECTQGIQEINNSEVLKIAEDALFGLKYSFASVAANLDQPLEPNSLENDFKRSLKTFKDEKLQTVVKNAKMLVDLDESGRKAIFGRYGVMDKETFIAKGGFNKVSNFLDMKSPIKIDKKLLGIKVNSLKVPVDVIKRVDGGLLIPKETLPNNWTEFESIKEKDVEDIDDSYDSRLFDESRFNDIWDEDIVDNVIDDHDINSGDFEEQSRFNYLSLYIRKIKCVDETNPEWWGHDEIALAGVSIDENGDTKKIKEKYIGGGFDDGDSKYYGSSWCYETFNINEGGNRWPKRYTITYLLAEKDYGGLSAALDKLWSYVRTYVLTQISNAVAAGATAFEIPPAIAAAIGKAVAWVIDRLFNWIISSLSDDIFKAQIATCMIKSQTSRFYHSNCDYRTYSNTYRSHFYGYGGHYFIEYYWKLS